MATERYTIEHIINNIFNGLDLNAVYSTENAFNAAYNSDTNSLNINLLSGGLALIYADTTEFPTIGDEGFLYLDTSQRVL